MSEVKDMNLEKRDIAIKWVKDYLKYLLKLNQKRLKEIEKQNQLSGEEKETISFIEFITGCKEYKKRIEAESDKNKKADLGSELIYYKLLYGDYVILNNIAIEEIVEFVAQAMSMAESDVFSDLTSAMNESHFVAEQLSRLAKSGKIDGEKQVSLQNYIDFFNTNRGELYACTGFYRGLIGSISCSDNPGGITVSNEKLDAYLKYRTSGFLEYGATYGDNIYFEDNFPGILFPRISFPRKTEGVNEYFRSEGLDFLAQEVYTKKEAIDSIKLLYKFVSNPDYVMDDEVVEQLADFLGNKVLEDECQQYKAYERDDTFVRQSSNYSRLINRFKKVLIKAIKKFYAIHGDSTIYNYENFWVKIGPDSHMYFNRNDLVSVELKKDLIIVNMKKEKIEMRSHSNTHSQSNS